MGLTIRRIIDFVEGFQLENLNSEIPKGTQVSFVLPKKLQYELNNLAL